MTGSVFTSLTLLTRSHVRRRTFADFDRDETDLSPIRAEEPDVFSAGEEAENRNLVWFVGAADSADCLFLCFI